ncbi:hypothetical protein GDO81_005755 [Engystomops pustulosus]|uniref:Uncharacterized protein n=1 Tax=Engystomops pustulosus TaxID=76066 RepID=A0AAV7CRE3_ENGPU|nr:hypothetical protein GDO81_005755 [Engystomops pustulosus]
MIEDFMTDGETYIYNNPVHGDDCNREQVYSLYRRENQNWKYAGTELVDGFAGQVLLCNSFIVECICFFDHFFCIFCEIKEVKIIIVWVK